MSVVGFVGCKIDFSEEPNWLETLRVECRVRTYFCSWYLSFLTMMMKMCGDGWLRYDAGRDAGRSHL